MNRVFARLTPHLIVDQVIVISDEDCGNLSFPDSEPLGQAFIHALYGNEDTWLETSITGEYRGKYAGIGDTYDPTTDTFNTPTRTNPQEE
jgi:hypothetical protein